MTLRRRSYHHILETRPTYSCQRYDPITGKGALGVEFAGTAVSSTSSFGAGISPLAADAMSSVLVDVNADLQWSEGSYRGFFTLTIDSNTLNATYYAMNNVSAYQDSSLSPLNTFMFIEYRTRFRQLGCLRQRPFRGRERYEYLTSIQLYDLNMSYRSEQDISSGRWRGGQRWCSEVQCGQCDQSNRQLIANKVLKYIQVNKEWKLHRCSTRKARSKFAVLSSESDSCAQSHQMRRKGNLVF